ncbi:MAG: FHA domain-containing protein [Anaerolineaceae bacterium]|nr:FHA domain-containing protein [Anaerolineaceae bacterium]
MQISKRDAKTKLRGISMISLRIKRITFIAILLSGIFLPFIQDNSVFAQQNLNLIINSLVTNENQDEMSMSIYFTVVDRLTGRPITDAEIGGAELELLEMGVEQTAVVKKPDTPFYIAMVLDASGSMLGAEKDLQDAAINGVRNAPQGTKFSVFQFNEQIEELSTFADTEDRTLSAIRKVKPLYGKGTCLYDAAYEAIDSLLDAPAGRRTVILFTDGRDELANGNPCSKHTYDEVLDFASQSDVRVGINTIGLGKTGINDDELISLANNTGGFSAIGEQNEIGNLFDLIMDALEAQWVASLDIYPTKGEHTGVFRVTMEDGTTVNSQFTFESGKNYEVPPDLPGFKLESLKFEKGPNVYEVSVAITNPTLVHTLDLAIWERSGGTKVYGNTFAYPSDPMPYSLPASNLVLNGDYILILTAFDANGNPLADIEGDTDFLNHQFKYNPEVQSASVEISSVSIDKNLIVKLTIIGQPEQIAKYEGWLIDEETKAQVPDSAFSVESLGDGNSISIPMEKISTGKYSIVLQALDSSNQVLSRAEYNGVVYSPKKVSIFAKIFNGLKERPILIVAIFGIIFVFIGFLIITSIIASRKTGTPVLQQEGSIEAVMMSPKQKSGASGVPIMRTEVFSTDEVKKAVGGPIPSRGASQKMPTATVRVGKSPDSKVNGQTFMIHKIPFRIGRVDSHLTITDKLISRGHAEIIYDNSSRKFLIKDNGSANGTWISGKRIPPNQPIALSNGQVIQLGMATQITFEIS